MNKKGFTLIELLAVILILGIIALIAIPVVTNIIEESKKGAAERSKDGFISAVENQVAISGMSSNYTKITDGTYTVSSLLSAEYGVVVKGTKPTDDSWITITDGEVTNYSLVMNGYVLAKGAETVKGTTPVTNALISGPTKVAAQTGETHKGIVYLDPTDLTKVCNASNSSSATETKIGCMKWYIFNDTGDNYTMILDHNTIARIKWNDSNVNVAYESSNLKSVVDDLVTTSKWKVSPRLITADEVNTITGKTGFDLKNLSSWYYLDTKTQTVATFTTTTRSKYDWLYNNLNLCKSDSDDYGCVIENNNTYTGYGTAGSGPTWAYWVSTTLGNAGAGPNVWSLNRLGGLRSTRSNNPDLGIRPVITISKSIIS